MARPKKDSAVDFSTDHDMSVGLIDRATCPPGEAFALLKDKTNKGLRLRITPTGGKYWQFEARIKGKLFTRALGQWPAIGIKEAQDEALRLRGMAAKGIDPRVVEAAEQERLAAEREAERLRQETEHKRIEAEARAAEDAQKFNLEALCKHYADHLEAMGRKAHRDARSIFKIHVFKAHPGIAKTPAKLVTDEQVSDMMRALIETGKGRTANKLRSYLRAAFATARSAKSTPTTPLIFKSFDIRHNPAAETSPDRRANKVDKNPLELPDLRAYWKQIRDMAGVRGAVLRLHLLTGGQRIEQLVNLRTKDVQDDAILLFDGKGKPGQAPRPHLVPLVPEAQAALAALHPAGEYAISTDGGRTHVHATTLSGWAKDAAKELHEFDAKRIRSGVETALAAAGFSSDIRGRLQSHGIAGVQARHYDGHDYMPQKRQALLTLFNLLKATDTAKVVPIRAA